MTSRTTTLAAEAPVEVGAVLNIGGGGGKTVNEVLRAVSDAIGKWIEPVYQPRRPGDVRHTKADISEAAAQLGWKPEARWEEAVASTVDGSWRSPPDKQKRRPRRLFLLRL